MSHTTDTQQFRFFAVKNRVYDSRLNVVDRGDLVSGHHTLEAAHAVADRGHMVVVERGDGPLPRGAV